MQHGRDQLLQNWASVGYDAEESAELPSEEFVEINRGDDFGWPYCYHNRFLGHLVLAPEYRGTGAPVRQARLIDVAGTGCHVHRSGPPVRDASSSGALRNRTSGATARKTASSSV